MNEAEREPTMEEKIDEILRIGNILIQAMPEARGFQTRQMNARVGGANSARINELGEKLENIEKVLEEKDKDEEAKF